MIVLAGVDVTDGNQVVAGRGASFKRDFVGQDQFAGGIEFSLVVVAEPMLLGTAGDRAAWYESFKRTGGCLSGHRSPERSCRDGGCRPSMKGLVGRDSCVMPWVCVR